MVDRDIVAHRILSLNESLQNLAGAHATDATRLRTDPMRRAAVERWLQLAIEACIDMAYHVVADRGWTPPDSARGSFLALAAHGVIAAELADALARATSMRNVLVHDYIAVDLEQVARVVRDNLNDLRAFGAAMARLIEDDA